MSLKDYLYHFHFRSIFYIPLFNSKGTPLKSDIFVPELLRRPEGIF